MTNPAAVDELIHNIRTLATYQGETPVGRQNDAYYIMPEEFLPVPHFAGCVVGRYGKFAFLSREIPQTLYQFVAAHEIAVSRLLDVPGILELTPERQFYELGLIHHGELTDGQRAFTQKHLLPMYLTLAEHFAKVDFGRQILRAVDVSRTMFQFRLGNLAIAA